jgi:hypothetical protein
MSRPKTAAQWRREVPAYDRMIRDVEQATVRLPFGGGRAAVAHIDPDTETVSFIVRVTAPDLPLLHRLERAEADAYRRYRTEREV